MADKKKRTLNEILEDYQKIENDLINNNGELTEEIETVLDVNELELGDKLNGYEHFVRYLKSKIDYLKSMEEHYSKRRKSLENSILRCKASMTNALVITNTAKVKTEDFNFSLGESKKWSINFDLLDENKKTSLIDEGLAENIFKPKLKDIKAYFTDSKNKDMPEWINIESTDYIKVR
jgi:hypothetical protein